MKTIPRLFLTLVLLLAFLFTIIRFIADYPAGRWLFIHPTLVPSYAMNVQRPVSSMDDDFGLRRTVFETDQSVDTIQQFYRANLPKRGWAYRCTVRSADPPCGNWVLDAPEDELVDVYDRGTPGASNWRTFEISISKPDAGGIRRVWLYDGGWGSRVASPGEPITLKHPEFAILGNWRTTDVPSGIDFLLRFYEGGRIKILFPSLVEVDGLDGEYEWVENGDLRLIFHWYFQSIEIENSSCEKYAPSFLKGFCQHQVVDESESYPEPEIVPQSLYPGPPYPEPLPVPTPAPGAINQLDEFFEAVIDGDTLTLTHQSGATQTFHRVTGD